jgi:hypothetical protein
MLSTSDATIPDPNQGVRMQRFQEYYEDLKKFRENVTCPKPTNEDET